MVYLLRMTRCAALLAGAFLVLAGCGYEFVRHRASGGEAHSVALSTLRNDSLERGYELTVSDAIRREFLRRGALRMVGDASAADVVISGRINPVRVAPQAFSSILQTLEYEVFVSVDLEIERREGADVTVWPGALRVSEFYTASPDVEASRKNREEALRRVAGILAARVHDSVSESLRP